MIAAFLRAVDRYGVTKRGEQYRGWSQLPPPMVTPPPMTVETTKAIFAAVAGGPPLTKANLPDAYRRAVLVTHPDWGGSDVEFRKVQQAKEFLEKNL